MNIALMSEPYDSDDTGPVVTLESLPAGSLSMTQVESLDEADAIEIAAPLVINTATSRVTHIDLLYDDTHHYLGWNPTDGQWEQILLVVDSDEEFYVESAIAVYDDETGELEIGFDPNESPEIEDFIEFIWRYVEHTYSETDDLHNLMEEAHEKLPEDDE